MDKPKLDRSYRVNYLLHWWELYQSERDAHNDGFTHFQMGRPITDNPHNPFGFNNHDYYAWNNGWRYGRDGSEPSASR